MQQREGHDQEWISKVHFVERVGSITLLAARYKREMINVSQKQVIRVLPENGFLFRPAYDSGVSRAREDHAISHTFSAVSTTKGDMTF